MANETTKPEAMELTVLHHPEIIGGFVWEHVAREALAAAKRDGIREGLEMALGLTSSIRKELLADGRKGGRSAMLGAVSTVEGAIFRELAAIRAKAKEVGQ